MAHARDALWENGHDESVEVNQRALIDKVLARYSGEFTVFRELLQNSDDAGAKAVEIHFETKEYLDSKTQNDSLTLDAAQSKRQVLDRKAALVHQWSFKNNGMVFRDEDWSRLKKIAEGNPDEEKIGAFGVGFYSLFSVTEEPFVTSGGQWMGFYWKDKKDQLFARRGTLPSTDADPWTTFEMSLREPAPIPRAFDFTRFIASSITFMTHLLEVSIYLDGRRISRLSKDPGVPKSVGIPKGLKRSSPSGMMHVSDIQTTPLSIKAEVMQWVYMAGTERPTPSKAIAKSASTGASGGFFSSLFSTLSGANTPQRTLTPVPVSDDIEKIDPTAISESSVVLSIFTADIGVQLDQKIRLELHRSTKKNPPTKMRLELIYTGKDEYDASRKEDEKQPESTGSVFQGLRADLDGAGSARVFIGHSTGQTTGLGGHMAARFIPTVERESIDLVDRTVAVWNKELLYVGGFLARAAYEIELENVRHLWTGASESSTGREVNASSDEELKSWLRGRALHALKFFTFHTSTPSSLVSTLLEEAFFACIATSLLSKLSPSHGFPLISTAGVRNASDVRMPDAAFSGFLKDLPVIPEEVLTGAKPMVDALRVRGMIKDITFVDVLGELRSRTLSEAEMTACFRWWITVQKQGEATRSQQIRTELLNAAVLSMTEKEGQDEKIVPMSSIKTFLNVRGMGAAIPVDGPLPAYLLPVSIGRHFDPQALTSAFPWRELTVLDWLQYIVNPTEPPLSADVNINLSAPWAERVFQVLTRSWPQLSRSAQEEVAGLLKDKTCIPTSAGMKTPEEAYFQSAHVFRDLPIVMFPSGTAVKGPLEKVLLVIGVRKHVDLQIVFNRMIKTGDWTIAELTKYLVAVRSTLTDVEMERLRMTAAFPQEQSAEGGTKARITRFKASDLYEPLDIFRQLGLPIIDWGTHTKWRNNSEEAKLLYGLGLRRFPPLHELVSLAANANPSTRAIALKYLLDNFVSKYSDFDPANFSELAFIPALKDGASCMAKHHEVYASPSAALLGFIVVDPSLDNDAVTKLKISMHPPTAKLVNLLQKSPPQSEVVARQWFGVLATRITDFSAYELNTLSQVPFVPVKNAADSSSRMLPPSQCYFKGDSRAQFHSKLFVFVDFGREANAFLSACGIKNEPSVEEIAKILLENPRKFYELAEGRDNFLVELRNLAVNRRLISSGTFNRLKRSAALLGSRRVKKTSPKGKPQVADALADPEEDDWDVEYNLLTPAQVAIVADDMNAYQLWGNEIFTAPQEDLLEDFYLDLGSKRLSSLVREEYQTTSEIKNSRKAVEMRTLILERLPLFLHGHPHARPRISLASLNNEKNFVVRMFGKLKVIKSLHFGNVHPSRTQDASAVSKQDGRGPHELWLAGNEQVDMFEVSTAMCRLLFESQKVNDAVVLMVILNSDLKGLKRRGYNVERILQQQKAGREAAEAAIRDQAKAMADANMVKASSQNEKLVSPPVSPTTTQPDLLESGLANDPLKRTQLASVFRNSLDGWKRKLNTKHDTPDSAGEPSLPALPPAVTPGQAIRPTSSNVTPAGAGPDTLAPPSGQTAGTRHSSPKPGVTPRTNIASNIEMAVNACREERGQNLQNQTDMRTVKESLNDGYCDVTGHGADMSLVGEMGNIKIFVSKGAPVSMMTVKSEVLARFIYVIRPLSEVYKLPTTSVHIFYDLAGELIAFNRNASLFLNLRYFEAWHDQNVRNGDMSDAYVSWYFTLAHEIAHNLVKPHNSEHEFWFSSICEGYMPALVRLLSTSVA
ncbi:hypothetical protein B0H21DRAFT_817732 [Amylocystis lapponica]|nr:hypothetical protein B0H21DRAFT_817732 [Amylocystis lapponica]